MRNDILIGILITLLNEGKCTYNYLAEKFEVCKKTIQRYMTTLEMAGIPTISTFGRNGGTEIIGAFNLENIFFTTNEIERLLLHLKSSPLGCLDNIDKQIEEKLLFKYKKVTSAYQSPFLIDHKSWGYSKTVSPIIKLLSDKIGTQKTYNMHYINSSGTSSIRTISPYKIVYKDFKWYLFAHCHKSHENRIFKLNRIQEISTSDSEFIPNIHTDDEILARLESVFDTIQLKLEIDSSILMDIEEWMQITSIKETTAGKLEISGVATKTSGLIDKIMYYSPAIKLLAPESLITDIKKRCKHISHIYTT